MPQSNAATRPSTDPATPLVAVCVITYLRPEGLRRLIESLAKLHFARHPTRLECIVVDNDPAGSSRSVCDSLRDASPFVIKYEIEPRRGIPFARNRSVALIDDDAEFAVFVDDDETVEPDWLDELRDVQQRFNADVVAGPVLPRFEQTPPRWAVRGGFFELIRHKTGESLEYAYTNNTLIRSQILRDMQPVFDERLALAGGSDTHYFRRVHDAGYSLVWADDAIVYDHVPASRVRVRWVLQRAFRYGTTAAYVERDVRSRRLGVLAIGCYRIGKGALFLPIAWVFGAHHAVTYLRHIAYGAGMVSGSFGMKYDEYRTTHGR